MQALMNLQTIQASHVIATCCVSYYLGADSFIVSLKEGLFPQTTFTDYTVSLAIAAFLLTALNGIVITDVEDAQGFFGKAEALSKGIIYKKTNFGHLIILAVYTVILLAAYFGGGIKGEIGAIILSTLVVSNLLVPVALIFLLNPESIKRFVGEPTDIEKKLSNKGEDVTVADAAVRIDFWYMCITAMIVIGTSRMFDENSEALGLHNDEQREMIEDTFGVYEVVGAFVCGTLMTMLRSKISPSLLVIFTVLVGGLGQLPMIYPALFSNAMQIAVASAAFAEGGLMVALASFVHEEYGTENFGILYGAMLSFGAAGLYAYDEVYFPNVFEWFAEENAKGVKYFKAYGKWNELLFSSFAATYGIVLVLAIVSHVSVKRREHTNSTKLAMVKF